MENGENGKVERMAVVNGTSLGAKTRYRQSDAFCLVEVIEKILFLLK